jgi:hypothetical protein
MVTSSVDIEAYSRVQRGLAHPDIAVDLDMA